MESKNIGALIASLIFVYMLATSFYHICGDNWNAVFRQAYFNGTNYLLIIGLLIVVYKKSESNITKSLIKWSGIPYSSMQLIYVILLVFQVVNKEVDLFFIISFVLIFALGLFKISQP